MRSTPMMLRSCLTLLALTGLAAGCVFDPPPVEMTGSTSAGDSGSTASADAPGETTVDPTAADGDTGGPGVCGDAGRGGREGGR